MKQLRKAIGGALVSAGGTLVTAATSGGGVTVAEWLVILGTTAGAFGTVYALENEPAT